MENRWRVLAVVLVAAVMDLLDATVMNVAGPSVRAALGGGPALVQWLTAGYTLAFGVLLVVGARLGDRWGRRRLFLIGAAGFTVASAGCALAWSPGSLLVARVVQGGFGALMIPQGFGLLTEVFADGRERGRAFAMFGPVSAFAAIAAPILAGALIAADPGGADAGGLGWRLIFLINVPLGAFAIHGALAWMPDAAGDRGVRIDPLGAVLVAAGSGLLVHPLIQGGEAGWPWWAFAECGLGLAAFVALARRQGTSRSPILVPSLMRKRPFVAGLAVALVFFAGVGGLLLVVSLYLQTTLGYSALRCAVALVPLAAGIAAGSLAAPRLAPRLGRRLVHAALGVKAAGVLALAPIVSAGTAGPPFAAATLIIGAGMGLLFGTLIRSVLAAATGPEIGSASGALTAVQQLATALGVAVLGTVFLGAGAPSALLIVAAGAAVCAALVLLLPRGAAHLVNGEQA